MARKSDILYVNFYTDGSAARKIAPAFPETNPQRKPRAKRQPKKVIYLDPVAVCSLVVAVGLLIMMAVGLTQIQNARLEMEEMEAYLAQLQQENDTLYQQYREGYDLEDIEKSALALGMVPKTQVPSVQIHLQQSEQPPVNNIFTEFIAFLTNLFA